MRVGDVRTEVRLQEFFPESDPEYRLYRQVRESLGSADDLLRISVPNEPHIFRTEFLHSLKALTLEVDSLSHVSRATSIATLKKPIGAPLGVLRVPYVRFAEHLVAEDSLRIVRDRVFTRPFVVGDGNVATVLVEPADGLSLQMADSLIQHMRAACDRYFPGRCYIGGIRHLEVNYARMSRETLLEMIGYSLLLIVVLLVVLFRSPVGVLVPLAVVSGSLLVFLGYLVLVDRPLGIMAILFPTLILIVGLSDVIHLLSRYDSILIRGGDTKTLLPHVLREIGPVLLLTSLTTALGLLTFAQSGMVALRHFGYDAAVAVMIGFAATLLLVPATVSLRPRGDRPVLREGFTRKWTGLAQVITQISSRRPGRVILATSIVTLVALTGVLRISTNSRLAFRFSDNPSLAEEIDFFDTRVGGIRSLQLAVAAKSEHGLNSLEVLHEIRALHRHLTDDTLYSNVLSPVTYYEGLHRVWRPLAREASLPASDTELRRYELRSTSLEHLMPVRPVNSRRDSGLIFASIPDMGRNDASRITSALFEWIDTHVDTSLVSFRQTGTSYMIDRGHLHRIHNMFIGLAIAILAVALVITLILRDVRMLFVALLVNLLPLIWAAGIMGWFGIELRGTTTMIFTIGFVIAVDDTLHFITAYAWRRREGLPHDLAVEATILRAGYGIAITSMALLGGFLVLVLATFWEIRIFGLMISLLLACALATDLLLLPALLQRWPPAKLRAGTSGIPEAGRLGETESSG